MSPGVPGVYGSSGFPGSSGSPVPSVPGVGVGGVGGVGGCVIFVQCAVNVTSDVTVSLAKSHFVSPLYQPVNV